MRPGHPHHRRGEWPHPGIGKEDKERQDHDGDQQGRDGEARDRQGPGGNRPRDLGQPRDQPRQAPRRDMPAAPERETDPEQVDDR